MRAALGLRLAGPLAVLSYGFTGLCPPRARITCSETGGEGVRYIMHTDRAAPWLPALGYAGLYAQIPYQSSSHDAMVLVGFQKVYTHV